MDYSFKNLKTRLESESTRSYKARGILVKRCPQCQIALEHCICDDLAPQNSSIDFVFIMHHDEVFKPTNTGRLVGDIFPKASYYFCWDRLSPNPELLELLADPSRYCVLVFPVEDERERKVIGDFKMDAAKKRQTRKLTLILLDGSWRQGRRMLNLSEWLKDIPIMKLSPDFLSAYATRKACEDSHLSTAEAVALALSVAGEQKLSAALMAYFEKFNRNYIKMRSNHRPPNTLSARK